MFTCVARFTGTLVPIDLVNAGSIVAGIAFAIIDVHFAVDSWERKHFSQQNVHKRDVAMAHLIFFVTCSAFRAAANVGILTVLTGATVSAGLA